MPRINLFYISTIVLGIALYFVLKPRNTHEISFFGFVENLETEINYNYPVVVEKILVKPGQEVHTGDTLASLYRQERNESLQDQSFRITTLEAEEALWVERKRNEIRQLQGEMQEEVTELDAEIETLTEKLRYKQTVVQQLQSVTTDSSIYTPMQNEIGHLEKQKHILQSRFEQMIDGLEQEIKRGQNPFRSRIALLQAEQAFDEQQRLQKIPVLAPSNGLIGTISCKEAEHIPSFKTLLTFYEPHSGMIKGYVHEDLILEVGIGDDFEVSSLKNEDWNYEGKVIGLGSRIVEIPSRLRKRPEIKSYGREVLVEITKDNDFLQREKVGLRMADTSN